MKYNFEKLLQEGNQIRKYLNAAGGGITYRSPISDTWNNSQNWRSQTNTSYENVYRNMYAQPEFNMEEYNDFLGKYYDLMRNSKYQKGKGAVYYAGTNDYQKEFDRRGFHTEDFTNGWEHVANAYTGDRFDANHLWGGGDDYVGLTTANRYANSWNADELVRQNEIAKLYGMVWTPDDRSAGLETNDGRLFYKLAKLTNTPIESQENQKEQQQEESPEEQTPVKEYPIPEPNRENTPWTDWIPLSAQLGNDLMSAWRQYDSQTKMRFPLIEGPFKQHKVTNNYHLRTGMQLNANELRNLAAFRSNSSDMRQNLDNMRKYDTLASEIENQAEQIKADTTFKERQIAEDVANENNRVGAEVANHNTAANAAAWNNILDARRRRDLATTSALNSYIGNMYTSHGEWLKDARLNDLLYALGVNGYMASVDAQKAYDEFNGLDEFKSKAYNDFKNWFNTDLSRSMEGFDKASWNAAIANGTSEDYLKNLYRTSKDAQVYRDAWTKELLDAEQLLIDRLQMIKMRHQVSGYYLPATVTNLGIYRRGQFAPTYQSIFSHKRGGSVRARAIDYWEHIRKENQSTKKAQEKRNSDNNKKLQQDLDRLTREQLILLRSIFK